MTDPTAVVRAAPASEQAARKRSTALTLTGVLTAIYLAFLALVLGAPATMAGDVAPNLTLGLILGALAIIAAIGLSWVYVARANRDQATRAFGGRP